MIYESYLGGVLIHHGVKGMRWGVRRTPEQLGHVTNPAVANAEEAVKIVDGVYQSSKGFTVKQNKFTEWCLKAGTDHADEFFSVGYKTTDADRLFRDIEKGFDLSKKCDTVSIGKTPRKVQHSHVAWRYGAKTVQNRLAERWAGIEFAVCNRVY